MNADNDPKPHVYMFGEEVSEQGKKEEKMEMNNACWENKAYCKSHQGGGVIWGCILIFVGLILILNNFGVISWAFWHAITPLWPLLLVLLGVQVMLGRSIIARIIITVLTVALAIFAIVYGLIETQSPLAEQIPMEWRIPVETIHIIQINP